MNTKSFLYRELTEEELSRVISSALHTDIVEYQLLSGGLFNTTYRIRTGNCGEVVLRVGPVNRHLLMPFEHNLMLSEKLVYDHCRAAGIPVSEVLAMDISKSVVDRDFMIVRNIPSQPLYGMEISDDDLNRIYRDVGIHTAKMHAISGPKFGRIADVHRGGGFDRWSDCLKDELIQWESVAANSGVYSEEDLRRVHRIFDRYAPLLDEIAEPRLVHTDLWGGNILIREEDGVPQLAAIIDADRALWGDPDFDCACTQWMLNDSFADGYGRRFSTDPDHITRRRIYRLLILLFNAYVYKIEYDDPESMDYERKTARELIDLLDV